MLKALLKKQLLEILMTLFQKGKDGKRRSTGKIVLSILLFVYVFAVLFFLFVAMASQLCTPLVSAGFGWLYFALMGLVATVVGIIGSVFMTYTTLYQAKDNETLIAMPIQPSKILLSRMLSCYLLLCLFEASVMLPTGVVYWYSGFATGLQVVFFLLLMLILPLVALTLSCILGFAVAKISSYLPENRKSFISVFVSLAFIAVYYFVYFKANQYLQMVLTNAQQIDRTVRTVLYPFYQFGMASEGHVLPLLLFCVMTFVVFGAIYALLTHSFLTLVTTKRGAAKAKFSTQQIKTSTQNGALLKKEFTHFKGSAVYMLNCGLSTAILLIAAVAAVVKASWLQSWTGTIGDAGTIALLAAAAIALLTSMNDITAPSISLEGSSLWILQSMPIAPWSVLKAKLKLHLWLTLLPAAILAVVLSLVLSLHLLSALLLLLFTGGFVWLCAACGLCINLKMPSLNWSSETVPVKQNIGVMLALFGSWAVVLLLGGLYLALRNTLSATLFLALSTLLVGAVSTALTLWLKKRGAQIFATL